jgi:hypothetical protein
MKWKAKFLSNDPENGTTRVRRKFVWKPTQIEDEILFLCHYNILEIFVINTYRGKIDGVAKEFNAIGIWIPLEKRLIK